MNCPFCEAENRGGDNCRLCGHPLAGPALIKRASVIAGRYEVLGLLGRGGMGMVYKAHDRALDDVIALKVLRSEISQDKDLANRFRQEIRLARKVRHRNVCAIHEYVEDGGLRCIAMELVEGLNLRQILKHSGPLPTREAQRLAIQAADGLEAIHEAGVIHRDLKTSNMMRDTKGQLRLMDFGIAKEWRVDATATSTVLGTPEYLSPEQARGDRVDFRSDVYALGIVIFELFTGDVPFKADAPLGVIMKHINEPPPFDGPEGAQLPPEIVPILRRALAKSAQDRQQSVAELAEALRMAGAADGQSFASTTTPMPLPFTAVTPSPFATDPATAPVGLAGDLRSMELSMVLRWIASGSKTGTLFLDDGSIKKRIVFRKGMVTSSWSNNPRESLGQFLVRDSWISEEQLFNALLKQEETGRLLGTILVEEEGLKEEELRCAMYAKTEETVYDLFLWTEGRFEFRDGDIPANAPISIELLVPDILEEGMRRREDWRRIRDTIPAGQVVFRVLDASRQIEDVRALQVLELAAKGKTPMDIALESRFSDYEVATALESLCTQGILAVDLVADEVPTGATLHAIQELLAVADQRLREDRLEEALEAYESVLELDRLNQQAKKGLIAVVEARHRVRARRTVPLDAVPVLNTALESLTLAHVDPQEAFILSRINGQWDVQSILKVCPMGEEDALLAFARLLSRKIIGLK